MKWKRILLIIGLILVTLFALGTYRFYKLGPVAPAYVAKTLCSGIFVSGRAAESVFEEDVPKESVFGMTDYEVDYDRKVVTASISGLVSRQALYRDGLGCTLLSGVTEEELRAQVDGFTRTTPAVDLSLPWPDGEAANTAVQTNGIDLTRLEQAIDRAFAEIDTLALKWTRAVVVVQGGRIVAERYAPNVTPNTPLLGWSMTKSVTNALVGILVGAGKLSLDEPAPVDEWRSPGDPRGEITLAHLLHMSSGLQFDESTDNAQSHVTRMLFLEPDAATFAAARPRVAEPNERFAYSSGTSNILASIVAKAAGDDLATRLRFPYETLFDRIGMRTAVFEPDASGTIVGSSFLYASARDWARIGLLYLRDGVWNGERILPEGWVEFSTTPAPAAPNGSFGSQLWLNAGEPGALSKRPWPSLPVDTYMMLGFQGQSVTVVPSYDAVIVRLGMTHNEDVWDVESFVSDVLAALPPAADCFESVDEECSI